MSKPTVETRQAGQAFLLLLLVLVAIVMAIALPNMLDAIQRGNQKRTMSDLRTIGTAVESYQVDRGAPPRLIGDGIDIDTLAPVLQPTFVKELPRIDPWGRTYRWHSAGGDEYSIVSLGKDERADSELPYGATTSFAADVYYSDGSFTVYPEGTMN